MTRVIKSSDENTISIPAWLMKTLNLHEGDQVKAVVSGETFRLAKIDRFLKLRGVLANDSAFDEAIKYLDGAWQIWTTQISAYSASPKLPDR